jgi:hypothetical protein
MPRWTLGFDESTVRVVLLVKAICPNCGAPTGLREGQRFVICAYCDLSMRVESAGAAGNGSGQTAVTKGEVPPETIRQVKQLVLDGQRAEAVRTYANAAAISEADAETAVNALLVPDLLRLFRNMPVNAAGFGVALVLCLAAAGGLAASVVPEVRPVPLAICAVLLVLFVRWLVPKARSSVIARFGARGRARVVRRAVLQPSAGRGGTVALVLFEVTPDSGAAPFLDEEPLYVRDTSVEKLAPGNVVRVRYDEPARQRVFPETPIEVVGRERGE